MTTTKIGSLLRDARAARGFSLHELARRVGASPSYLCRIEQGDRSRKPSPRLLARIADALRLDRDQAFAAAGRLPADLERFVLTTPGLMQRLREEMAA